MVLLHFISLLSMETKMLPECLFNMVLLLTTKLRYSTVLFIDYSGYELLPNCELTLMCSSVYKLLNWQWSFFSPQNYVIAPLHVASKYGNLNVVTLLVEKGSKVDIPNKVCSIMLLVLHTSYTLPIYMHFTLSLFGWSTFSASIKHHQFDLLFVSSIGRSDASSLCGKRWSRQSCGIPC